MKRVALSGTMLFVGMFGFIASVIYTFNHTLDNTWGANFMIFFMMIFIASVISITPSMDKLE